MPKYSTIPAMSALDADRFHSKVRRDGDYGACWPWLAGCNGCGYGSFPLGGKGYQAHRVAWTLAHGAIPDGLCVLHTCDNPKCCNPAHLWLGTQPDNIADMDAKGRRVVARGDASGARLHPETRARGARHGSRTHPERLARGLANGAYTHPERRVHMRGELQGGHKLTEGAVREIRLAYAAGGVSQSQLAKRYGVCQTAISHIVLGQTWAHVR